MKRPITFLFLLLALASRTRAQDVSRDTLVFHFPFDRYDSIYEQGRLEHLIELILPHDSVLIIGHTDSRGTEKYNRELSRKRAEFIKTSLDRDGRARHSGITGPVRLLALGKSQPVSPIDSLNRRVEVIFSHPRVSPPPPPAASSLPPVTPSSRPSIDTSKIDTVFTLKQIYFIANTPLFTEATVQALPSITNQLKKYMNQNMRILGYVNSPGPLLERKDHLFILSTKRAEAVYVYLISAGFDPRRLSYEGMGNSVMVNPNPVTKQDMDANMRVEIEVEKN